MLADGAAGVQIVDEGARAAGQGPAILVGVVSLRRIKQADALLIEAAGAEIAVQGAGALELVVADEGDVAAAEIETAHAVGLAGDEQAVVHGVAALRDDLVGEALGQVEQTVRIGEKRAVAGRLVAIGLLARRLGPGMSRQTREGEGGGGAGEQVAAGQAHGRLRETGDL